MTDVDDPGQLSRYLLGDLDDEATAAFESRYFESVQAFDRLEAAFDDLTDAYVRGNISPEDRRRFEERYLTNPNDRARVRFARTWRDARIAAAPPESVAEKPSVAAPRPPFLRSLIELLRAQTGALQLAVVLVLVAGPAWMLTRINRLSSEIDSVGAELGRQTTKAAEAAGRAADERGRRETLERRLAETSTSSFDLIPGVDRSGGTTLVVPVSATFVRFALGLESEAPKGALVVRIQTAGQAIAWGQEIDNPVARAVAEVTVPASVLTPNEYQVTVSSRQQGRLVELARYGFRIVRR